MGDEIGRNVAWFYCLKHHTVEPEDGCKAKNRLGPYPDPESAADALELLHEREERLTEEDRRWAGEPADGRDGAHGDAPGGDGATRR